VNILFVATEAAPYYRSGSLSDVVHGLAKELCVQGHDVRIVVPRYRTATYGPPAAPVMQDLKVSMGAFSRSAAVWKASDSPIVYFIEQNPYFGRDDFYGYADDYERFIFFTHAALEMVHSEEFRVAEQGWFPEIIQGFDWATGWMPGWLRQYRENDPRFDPVRFVLFINNIRRLGKFGRRAMSVADQGSSGYYEEIGETRDRVSFLGRGLLFADQVVMANPRFDPNENPLPDAAEALRPVIEARLKAGTLHGIVSRIDALAWDPAADRALAQRFTAATLDTRVANKLELQRRLNLPVDRDVPLLGVVNRLIPENGFDLLKAIRDSRAMLGDLQLVLLAEPGELGFRNTVQKWEAEQDGGRAWIRSRLLFDDPLARLIYAACDIYLLPAKEYPGGINQLIAMHYGAVPVARHTGLIALTVRDYAVGGPKRGGPDGFGIGFKFRDFTRPAFLEALTGALELYRGNRAAWKQIQVHNMRANLTWVSAAQDYFDLYTASLDVPLPPVAEGRRLALDAPTRLTQSLPELGNLPYGGSITDVLKEAARLVRYVLGCDAVYVSGLKTSAQLSAGDGGVRETERFAGSTGRPPDRAPLESEVAELLNQSTYNAWRHLGEIDMEGACQPIPGLEESQFAARQGWKTGWSVPVLVRGRLLGWIDAMYGENQDDKSWVIGALTSMANSFGLRLDTIRILLETETVSNIGRTLLEARSIADVIQKACESVEGSHAGSIAWFYPLRKGVLQAAQVHRGEDRTGKPTEKALLLAAALAEVALSERQVKYIAGWVEAPLDASSHREFRSLLGIPIVPAEGEAGDAEGVLMVAHESGAAFTRDHEYMLSHHLAPQVFAALRRAHALEAEDGMRVDQLTTLASSLVGGGVEMDELLQNVLDTLADVLNFRAGALYLLNAKTGRLELRAAYGYQQAFRDKGLSYAIGEGLTGYIAESREVLRFNSLAELHAHPRWKGGFNDKYKVKEPNAFLGMPLVVHETRESSHVIGVLKLEERKEDYTKATFDEADVDLGKMMASVIAAMVYNAQRSERKLQDFSANLRELSDALAGSRDRDALMQNIVDKLQQVLHVDAASLYLADDAATELVIQAAAGYQKPLVARKVKYKWGEGVTGRIASKREAVIKQSLRDLRREGGGADSGRYDAFHEGGVQPESFYGLPLMVGERTEPIGVLKVESKRSRFFSPEDVLLIGVMANVIATVVYNAQQTERRLKDFGIRLGELSGVLAGSRDRETLMQNIVDKLQEVLGVDAASLYLADEGGTELVIEAAAGYQRPLKEKKARYAWGQGVTGAIAADRKPVVARSLKELRDAGGGAGSGKYDQDHEGRVQPQSFYGLPLVVREKPRAIGVLKVESYKPWFFTNEDVLLIGMMANVIATVVYNVQKTERRLRDFSEGLKALSTVLAGGRDLRSLMADIVRKIADVLHVDAASLYLADDRGTELVIQAAAGYQEPLVAMKVKYRWGQGVTGAIAAKREPVVARSLAELREKGGNATSGANDQHHLEGFRPESFYGLPLVVSEKIDAIGVLKVESRLQRFFSDEDVVLIQMMANVIATVIYNARQSEQRLGDILRHLGSLSSPATETGALLRDLAQREDPEVIGQLAQALASILDQDPRRIDTEARALFEAKANRALYGQIAGWAEKEPVRWYFTLLDGIMDAHPRLQRWDRVMAIAQPWFELSQSAGDADLFGEKAGVVARNLAASIRVQWNPEPMDSAATWFGGVFQTVRLFGDEIQRIPLLFQRYGQLDEDNQVRLLSFLRDELKRPYPIAVLVLWNQRATPAQVQAVRQQMGVHAVDIVVASIADILKIQESPDRAAAFRSLVIRQATTPTPFIVEGPVPDSMFFGRDREIGEIIQYVGSGRSCVLVSGRRYGKTSILGRLHRTRLPDAGFRAVYCIVTPVASPEDFFKMPVFGMRPDAPSDCPQTIDELLDWSPTGKPLVLLVDEADKLVPVDSKNNWVMSKRLRAAANSGLRIVLAGERTLQHAVKDPTTPLLNLGSPLVLGPLEFPDVEKLITGPFKQLEIKLQDSDEIARYIFDFTSGHPNVVQRIGRRLIRDINRRKVRLIGIEDVKAVIEDPEFQRDDFLDVYWEQATRLEKIVTLLMVESEKSWILEDLVEALRRKCDLTPGPAEVDAALQRLVGLRRILRLDPRGYRFAVSAFPRVVKGSMISQTLLLVLADEYRKSGGRDDL
jgi:starch synthase